MEISRLGGSAFHYFLTSGEPTPHGPTKLAEPAVFTTFRLYATFGLGRSLAEAIIGASACLALVASVILKGLGFRPARFRVCLGHSHCHILCVFGACMFHRRW